MKQEVKDKWVTKLKSGAYNQSYRNLKKDENCFCALGVLCQVAVEEGIATWEQRYLNIYAVQSGSFSNAAVPTPEILDWAGLTYHNVDAIWKMNDVSLDTFSEIAAYIEGNL